MHAKLFGGGGVHPAAVHVGAGQGDRLISRDGVDGSQRRLRVIGPQGVSEPHADHVLVRIERALRAPCVQMFAEHVKGLFGAAGLNQIQSSQGVRPLGEVRVAVP